MNARGAIMATQVPQVEVIEALASEYAAIEELVTPLSEQQWGAPTPCPAWDVRANVAHIVGSELELDGSEPPPGLPAAWTAEHVRNKIGLSNERWIATLSGRPTADLLTTFRDVTARRVGALRQLSGEAWETECFTPGGRDTFGRFVRIRVFDCWMHEQDIRDALGRPGHDEGPEVEFVLDEISAALGFVVGKKAAAPHGSSVSFDLTGNAGRRIDVRVEDRAQVVEQLGEAATVTLRMAVPTFTRVAGGRVEATGAMTAIQISGDDELGRRVIDNLAYTI
jgi:uncharacterized protein (TIGR03083 family)